MKLYDLLGSSSLGTSSWLFTGALYNGYGPPDGFCFDIFCDDDPVCSKKLEQFVITIILLVIVK
jgi:hypothetical protein